MAEKRLIDANALDTELETLMVRFAALGRKRVAEDYNFVRTVLDTAPTVDAVSRSVCDQLMWERDVAIEQLKSYGVSFGEKADVTKVVRCKDCKHYNVFLLECHNGHMNGVIGIDGFCSYGERRTDG